MAKHTASLTSNTTVFICSTQRARENTMWEATLMAHGTWGSGTLTWKISPDGGTTKVAIQDSGADVTSTADDNFNIKLGFPDKNSDVISVYATLAGATNPSLTVVAVDNT